MSVWLILGVVILLVLLGTGAPIFVAFALGGGLIMLFHLGTPFEAMGQMFYASVDHVGLLAVPFFILAGSLMTSGGASRRLIDTANSLVGHLPGGMSTTVVAASTFFGALSGSHPATAVAIGTMMIPRMTELGYERRFSSALICNVTTVGLLIPPSVAAIIYGFATEMSIGKLFMAGIIPGLLMAAICGIAAVYLSWRRGYPRSPRAFWRERGRSLVKAIPALLMPVIVLGGIYTGVFTATEAAAIAALYALFVGAFVYRELNLTTLRQALAQGVKSSANIFFLIAGAMVVGKVLVVLQVPQVMTQAVVSAGFNALTFSLLAMVLLLFLGTFLEAAVMILVTIPVFWPIIVTLGVDPYMFYVLTTVMVGVGQATPPVGIVLYIMSDVSGEPVVPLFKESILWLILLTVVAIIVIFVPSLASWLPGTM